MLIAGNVETNDEDQTLVDKREDEEDKVFYYYYFYFMFLLLFPSSLLISLCFVSHAGRSLKCAALIINDHGRNCSLRLSA